MNGLLWAEGRRGSEEDGTQSYSGPQWWESKGRKPGPELGHPLVFRIPSCVL